MKSFSFRKTKKVRGAVQAPRTDPDNALKKLLARERDLYLVSTAMERGGMRSVPCR